MWLPLAALSFLTAGSLLGVVLLWRRLRRLEERLSERTQKGPFPPDRSTFDSVELSFAAMLAELEEKSRSILAEVEQRAAAAQSGDETQRALLSQTSEQVEARHPSPGGRPAAPLDGDGASPKAVAVRQLAAEGYDVLDIARRLGLGKGEVQLILNLGQDEVRRSSNS